ncbi:4-hydroxybenzoate polyprenyltransferase, mitochondrial-like [Patiria miniata]|uniref:4-hydroxybenzoate polyprenyltransferase, mitochondrial n=1 Tax=Patiria miniata TaxID=46514 RepID=A0A913ZY29_PATMI|nr:4-hydroxybenzoate polyprenyltransferase, mitochondrial-like [Patiria miniata]XP_038056462.1 4-hydroxybenzoate polyprenyltransferase, mitochondrial-like [Patiria miniata]
MLVTFNRLCRRWSPRSISCFSTPSNVTPSQHMTVQSCDNHCKHQVFNHRSSQRLMSSDVFDAQRAVSSHGSVILNCGAIQQCQHADQPSLFRRTHKPRPVLCIHKHMYSQLHRQHNQLCINQIGAGLGRHDLQCNRWTRCDSRPMSVLSSMVDAAPSKVQPYLRLMRVDKPIGTWLCYWPSAWGIALAADPGHFPSLYMLGLCGLGAVVVRGAGCTINDMWDRDFDKSVERTRSRPIASGDISRSQALVFLAAQLSVALGILLTLNTYCIVLGCVAVAPIIVYPLMKRFTYWPQVFLGLTFNFGALIGYAAIRGSCDWSIVLPLYASCIAWTIVYDTIYGHQDKRDDLALGLGSTSILMGDNTKYWLTGFGAAMVSGLMLVGAMAEQTVAYYLAVALTAAHIGNQVWTVDIHNPQDCWNKFQSNRRLGAIIFAGIVAGTLAKVSNSKKQQHEQGLDRDNENQAVES